MKINVNKVFRGIISSEYIIPICVAIAFFCMIFFFFPFREIIQFDPDEGLNLMRSMLVSLNFKLYTEISSDQPPLFTHIIAWMFKFTGFEVNPARIMVLLFATVMIFSCSLMLKMSWGNLAAFFFFLFAIGIPNLLDLSVSVMIGVPAISLACLSALLLFFWQRKRWHIFIIFSAIFMALSVLTKLFTIFLVPIFFIFIIGSEYFLKKEGQKLQNYFYSAVEWGGVFGTIIFFCGLILIGIENVSQILSPHISAETYLQYQGYGASINYRLESVIPLLFISLFGFIFSIYRKKYFSYLLLIWIVLAYLLLSIHRPVYAHHQLLITIPAAMLAAIGGSESFFSFLTFWQRKFQLSFLGIISIISFAAMVYCLSTNFINIFPKLNYQPKLSGFSLQGTTGKLRIIDEMKSYQMQTKWIFTDLPMYAFLVKKPVPPILATFSEKRLLTGSLTGQQLLSTLQIYQPEQVLLGRFKIPELETSLQKKYKMIYSPGSFKLFIRNDIFQK